jgi:hypothetical protein
VPQRPAREMPVRQKQMPPKLVQKMLALRILLLGF